MGGTMNKPNGLNGGVILGGKLWRCKKGHEQRGTAPSKWQFQIPLGPPLGGQQQVMMLQSGPVCLLCLLEWASETFPVTEFVDGETD